MGTGWQSRSLQEPGFLLGRLGLGPGSATVQRRAGCCSFLNPGIFICVKATGGSIEPTLNRCSADSALRGGGERI